MALRKEDDPFERAAEARESASHKRAVIRKYGEDLGKAYLAYTQEGLSEEKRKKARTAFSEELVTVLESGTHEEKVKAMSALLEAFEAKIEPIDQKAQEALNSTSVY